MLTHKALSMPPIATILPALDALVLRRLPFVDGGRNVSTGLDCYGLIRWAYGLAGCDLPTEPAQAMALFIEAGLSCQPWDVLASVSPGEPRPHLLLLTDVRTAYQMGARTGGVARVPLHRRPWSRLACTAWRYKGPPCA